MHSSPFVDGFAARRVVALVLVGLLVVSGVVGVLGSSGIAAAQSDSPPSNETASNDTLTQSEWRDWAHRVRNMSDSRAQQTVEDSPRETEVLKRVVRQTWRTNPVPTLDYAVRNRPREIINETHRNVDGHPRVSWLPPGDQDGPVNGGGNNSTNGTTGNNSSAASPVQQVIQEFQARNLGYSELSPGRQDRVREILRELNASDSDRNRNGLFNQLAEAFNAGTVRPGSEQAREKQERRDIIEEHLGESSGFNSPLPNIDINISSMMDIKLESIADAFVEGASTILTDVYNLAFSTPVPENSGWHNIFGTPTNEPFQPLYQQLLVDRLYPVTNYLLGIGVMILGVSVVMNPLVSRFQAIDLGIKFVTFLLLYAFTWPAITLMHGITNDITMWIRPSAEEMAALVDAIGVIEVGAIGAVGAYFAGSGGILATVFALGIGLGLRQIALEFFFPYVFPALVLLVYLSPWQRLRAYASMGIWQYVNVLTMVIPMAIVLKAAAIAGLALDGSGVVVMLTVIALFLVTASIPVVSTYFFIQKAGAATGYVTSAAGSAASRVGSAKDKIGGGEASSSDSTDSTTTATTSPGDRAQAMVGSVRASETSHSESQPRSVGEFGSSSEPEHDATDSATTAEHDAADSTTTAGKIRALHEQEKRDSMNPKAMKTAYFGQQSSRST